MTLSIKQLQYFVKVAETGQLSAAARELYISQSAITSAIQDLERQLNRPIFVRSARGVTLTGAGESLLPKAREIIRMVDEAAQVSTADPAATGRVRVGVTYTVMAYFVPQHIQQITAQYPNLEVSWHEMSRRDAERGVVAGELDFALLLTSNLRSPELGHETFVHSVRRLWTTPTHPLTKLSEIRFADIVKFPYALLTVDESERTTRAYWGPDLQPNVFFETSSIEAVRSVVANGNAVTILSDMVYRPWSLEGKRIDTAIVDQPVPDMRIGLAWLQGTEFSRGMTTLYDYFHRQFNMPGLPTRRR